MNMQIVRINSQIQGVELHVIAGLLRKFATQKLAIEACKMRVHELIRGSLT